MADVVQAVASTFAEFDADKSGFLDVGELQAALAKAGQSVSTEECTVIFLGMDKNQDGKVSLEEFVQVLAAASSNGPNGEPSTSDEPAPEAPVASDAKGIHNVPREYELILMAVLADGEVDPLERSMLSDYAADHPICQEFHEALLARAGWTLEEYDEGFKKEDPRRQLTSAPTSEPAMSNDVNRRVLADDPEQVDLEEVFKQSYERFVAAYSEDLRRATETTQAAVLAARVPLASYGRIRDELHNLKNSLHDRAKELVQAEWAEFGKLAVTSIEVKTAELQVVLDAQAGLEERYAKAAQEAKAAIEARDATQEESDKILGGARELLRAPEAAIQKAQTAQAEAESMLKRDQKLIAKLQETAKQTEEEWELHLIECLSKCTFSVKGDPVLESSDPRKADFGPAAVLMDNTLTKLEGGHGARLAFIVQKYEDAKEAASTKRKAEREEAKKALAASVEEAARNLAAKDDEARQRETEWEQERTKVQAHLEAARGATQQREVELKMLKEEVLAAAQSAISPAKHEKLESDLEAMRSTLAKVKQELNAKATELAAVTRSQELTNQRLHMEEELRVKERTAGQARLEDCFRALNAAQSAGKHGGYFFAAAPTPRVSRPRSLSPTGLLDLVRSSHDGSPSDGEHQQAACSPSAARSPQVATGLSHAAIGASPPSPPDPSRAHRGRRVDERKALRLGASKAPKAEGGSFTNTSPTATPKGPRTPKRKG